MPGYGVTEKKTHSSSIPEDVAVKVRQKIKGGFEAESAAEFAAKVQVVYRSELPTAQEVYQQRVRETPAITHTGSSVVVELLGADSLESVRVRNTSTDEARILEAAGLFVYVGLEPNTAFLQGTLRLDVAGGPKIEIQVGTVYTEVGEPDTVSFVSVIPPSP